MASLLLQLSEALFLLLQLASQALAGRRVLGDLITAVLEERGEYVD